MIKEDILDLIARSRLSVGKAAEILEVSIYDIHELAKSKRIKLSATQEQREKSRENVTKLLKKIGGFGIVKGRKRFKRDEKLLAE